MFTLLKRWRFWVIIALGIAATTVVAFIIISQISIEDAIYHTPIAVHFENRTAHAQIELNTNLFSELVNQALRDGAILYPTNSDIPQEIIHPQQFSLVLVDEPQPLFEIINGHTNELIFSLSQTYQDEHLSLFIYLHPKIYQEIKDKQDHQRLFGEITLALYYNSNFLVSAMETPEKEALQEFREQYLYDIDSWLDQLLLKLHQHRSRKLIEHISQRLYQLFSSQVFAASCTNPSCAETCWKTCSCSEPGFDCSEDDASCGISGTCSCNYGAKCGEGHPRAQGTCSGSPPNCSANCGTCPNGVSRTCSGCGCTGCGNWGDYTCAAACGASTETRYRTCYTSSCGTTTQSDSRDCEDCSACADTCTLCSNSCGSWCGYKTVGGKINCGNAICEDDCIYDCGCNSLAPSAPGLIAPANEAAFSNVPHVDLSWNLNGTNCGGGNGWGASCPDENKRFQLCIGSTAGTVCDYVNTNKGTGTSHHFTNGTSLTSVLPRVGENAYHWRVRAINRDQSANSATRSFTVVQPKNALTHSYRWPASLSTEGARR